MAKYFKREEFKCSHTGKNEIKDEFIERLDQLAQAVADYIEQVYGQERFPMVVTSGWRDKTHPVEAKKAKPGRHNEGIAADIRANNWQAYIIMKCAYELGFKGIARGKGFVHIDDREADYGVTWSY